jgi:light-regulated signal transduction histidine kinase (bacteriophytochrome)
MELISMDTIVDNHAEHHNNRTDWIIPVAITVIVIIFYWLADAVMDVFVFKNGHVFQQLFTPGYHEMIMRLQTMLLLAVLLSNMYFTNKRKQAEDEIRKLNAELSKHSTELVTANKELEAFSYSVSHDLRTPLTRIYSSSQALMDGYSSCFDENGTFFVRTINDACEQMEELIESLLTLSRVTNSEMNREVVDFSKLAREIVNDMQLAEPARMVVFEITPDVTAHGDYQLLKVVLENLLGNAWKFTKMSNEARIEFGVAEAAGERVYFVRDNGTGFDMKNAANLFKPFQRLHNPVKFPGTGVGLATVQRIIQRHGGRVWGEGAVDHGAVFYFTLK